MANGKTKLCLYCRKMTNTNNCESMPCDNCVKKRKKEQEPKWIYNAKDQEYRLKTMEGHLCCRLVRVYIRLEWKGFYEAANENDPDHIWDRECSIKFTTMGWGDAKGEKRVMAKIKQWYDDDFPDEITV